MSSTCTIKGEIAGSRMKWFWIILALLYLISPYDLIPGIHGVGWIDDIVILILLFLFLVRVRENKPGGSQPFGTWQDQQQSRPSGENKEDKAQKPPRTPHEILNLPPDADQDTIKAAYRRLANQYHPDKVSHLGKEFQELAERRFKEIQEAYQKLLR